MKGRLKDLYSIYDEREGKVREGGKMKGQNGRREEGWSLIFKLFKNYFMKKKVFLVFFIFINLSCEFFEEVQRFFIVFLRQGEFEVLIN